MKTEPIKNKVIMFYKLGDMQGPTTPDDQSSVKKKFKLETWSSFVIS